MPDREKVIKALEHCKDNQHVNDCNKCDYGGKTGTFCIRMIDAALTLLKEQEAKTGKWERQYSRTGVYANLFWWCSVCGEPTSYNDAGIFYKYCPHCGAKLEPCIET